MNVPTSDSTVRWSYFYLGHISWPEVAFPNAVGKLASHPQFALKLQHFRMHVVIGDGILKRIFTWQRLGSYPQSCCGRRSDFSMSQNRHAFVDVQTSRGEGQPPATFKRCAEISSHTEEMCSGTAPQGMQSSRDAIDHTIPTASREMPFSAALGIPKLVSASLCTA